MVVVEEKEAFRAWFVCQTHPNRLADRTAMNPSYVLVTAKQLWLNPRNCGYEGADRQTKFNVSASGRGLERRSYCSPGRLQRSRRGWDRWNHTVSSHQEGEQG